jgi:tight adherence protein B
MLAAAVGVLLVGMAGVAALAWLRWWWDDRTLKRRALEQIGLRQKRTARSTGASRRRNLSVGVFAVAAGLVGIIALGPVGILAAALPPGIINFQQRRAKAKRSMALVASLSSAVQLVVDNLRVGRDLVSSMAEVAKEAAWPVDEIFATVVAETRLGTRVDEAIARQAEVENERHLRIIASAIGLNVEYGGNLIDILSGVVETLEEEDRLRRSIETLTADGRLSAQILLALPVVGLLAISVMSPGYAEPLYSTNSGRVMVVLALLLGGVGFFWLRRLGNPDVIG